MEAFGILWIWGFCGDSHRFFCGYGMGMGIKIPSPRQPWRFYVGRTVWELRSVKVAHFLEMTHVLQVWLRQHAAAYSG